VDERLFWRGLPAAALLATACIDDNGSQRRAGLNLRHGSNMYGCDRPIAETYGGPPALGEPIDHVMTNPRKDPLCIQARPECRAHVSAKIPAHTMLMGGIARAPWSGITTAGPAGRGWLHAMRLKQTGHLTDLALPLAAAPHKNFTRTAQTPPMNTNNTH